MTMLIGLVVGSIIAALTGVAVFFSVRSARAASQQLVLVVTVRGLAFRFTYWKDSIDSAKLRLALNLAVEKLTAVWALADLYKLLDGVHVNVARGKYWTDPYSGRNVAGSAVPSTKSVAVAEDLAALAHELAHVMEAGPGRIAVEDHAKWQENGIAAAVESYEREWMVGS